MQNQLQIFENEEFGKVRVLEIGGAPWFVGKDITSILGYENGSRDINRHVDEEDRRNYRNGTSEFNNRGVTVINESGLYSLILSSKLPSAKRFKHWVTSEVLPSIRKHGAYITKEVLEEMLRNSEFTADLLNRLAGEREKNGVLVEYVAELRPKARYYDLVLQSKGVVQVSLIAKDYGLSAVSFNRLLHDLGIQYRVGGTWILYQRHADKGYTKSRTYYTASGGCVIHTYWTQAGRLFLYDALDASGILPLMEIEDAADFAYGEAWQ